MDGRVEGETREKGRMGEGEGGEGIMEEEKVRGRGEGIQTRLISVVPATLMISNGEKRRDRGSTGEVGILFV